MSKDSVPGKPSKLMKNKEEWALLCQKTNEMTIDDTGGPVEETSDLTTDGPQCESPLPQSSSVLASPSDSLMSTSSSTNEMTIDDTVGPVEENLNCNHQPTAGHNAISEITSATDVNNTNTTDTRQVSDSQPPETIKSSGSKCSGKYFTEPVLDVFKDDIIKTGPVPTKLKTGTPAFVSGSQNNQSLLKQIPSPDSNANDTTDNLATQNKQPLDSRGDPDFRLETSDLTTDGPHCESPLPQSSSVLASPSDSLMSTSTSSIKTTESSSSTSTSFNGGMLDFVILHTDNDCDEAQIFKEDLCTDAVEDNITVDLFSEIGQGTTVMQRVGTLHDRYRYILIFVTDSLEDDKHCRFLNELLITLGLRDGGSKAERVVPVFTKGGNCNILELSIIGGLPYYRRKSDNDLMMSAYLKSVKKLVCDAREKFPL